ncbi:MAG TPA: hypothetical protein VGS20_17275 [Candidatus Acidoferrales bacterium]|nr:hypothetical protein [Candidatus Acidoferrales bacterium]
MLGRFLLLIALFPPAAAAQSGPGGCQLPSGLWAKRQALQKQFDRAGPQAGAVFEAIQVVNAQYRGFLTAVADLHAKNRFAAVASCCDRVKNDLEAAMFCGLVRYIETDRKDPAAFLAAVPGTAEGVAALVDLDSAAAPGGGSSSLAAAPVLNLTGEMYRLILAGSEPATARYFWLFRHSGGAYADDAADQLEDLLSRHPDVVIRDWASLGKYWDLSQGITWDVDAGWWQGVIEGFRARCQPANPRCAAILGLLDKAARAAGAPPA